MFIVNASDLASALGLMLATIERKGTIPILAFALIESDRRGLKITATDMDCLISTYVPAEIDGPFAFCLKVKDAHSLVSLMDGNVTVTLKDDKATIKSKGGNHKLGIMPKEEFRQLELATKEIGTISGELLSSMINAAMVAAETNPDGEDRWKNIELSAKDGQLSITGICGPRIASAATPMDGEFYVVLPLRGAGILVNFAAISEEVKLSLADNLLTARSEKGEASFKISALKWPEWRMVIASEYKHSIEIDPAIVLPALKRAMLACEGRVVLRVDFQLTKNQMVLTTQGPHKEGREEVAIDCPSLNGDDLRLCLAGNQLADFFRVSKGAVIWQIPEGNPALLFKPKDPMAFEFQYVQALLKNKPL